MGLKNIMDQDISAENKCLKEENEKLIAVIDQMRAMQVILVKFKLEKAEGKCVKCEEEGEMMQITAFVYFKDNFGRTIEDVWNVHYCSWCLNQSIGSQSNDIENLYV